MTHDEDTIEAFFCPSRILIEKSVTDKPGKRRGGKQKTGDEEIGYFDWLAPNYELLEPIVDPTRLQAHSVLLDILNAIEPAPENVLDLGCGNGMLTSQILELLPGVHVYAIDGSLAMLTAARENLDEFSGQVTLAKADFRDAWEDVIEEPIDVIVHYNSLHHLPHEALREVYTRLVKVLRPGGWFLHGDSTEERLPDPVRRIATNIRNVQTQSAITDLCGNKELLEEFDRIRRQSEAKGQLTETPAMPEQQISWLIEAGFEFASRVYHDWHVSIFIARKPE